jgi:predicted transcriptional regulator of viral defense system
MRLQALKAQLDNLPIFSLQDIRKIDTTFQRPQLSYWVTQGRIRPFAGRYYIFSDRSVDEELLFMAANLIYPPSYISLESALSAYGIIPESVFGVTSVSSRKTNQFESDWGTLRYRTVKPALMFGYAVIENSAHSKYKLAHLEKAILDYLYLNAKISSAADFDGLRWNRVRLSESLQDSIFSDYLSFMDNRALSTRAKLLREYIHA